MSLKSLEGLPEEVSALYEKSDDGEYHLKTKGLQSALQKEREAREIAEKALKAREKSEVEEKARKEREDLERKGEYEKLSAADKAALRAAEERAQALESKLRNGARERALIDAMSEPGVHGIPKALLPHIVDLVEVIQDGENFRVVSKTDPAQKITDLIASKKKEMPWGFEASGASGFGSGPGGSGVAGKPWKEMSIKEQTETFKSNPEFAKKLMIGA